MRRIYITRSQAFVPGSFKIISLADYAHGPDPEPEEDFEGILEDYTVNFEDLDFWNSRHDLHHKCVGKVLARLQEVLNQMQQDGHTPRQLTQADTDAVSNPAWMKGHVDDGTRAEQNLPEHERIAILMFHLEELVQDLRAFDNTFYLVAS